MSLQGTWANDIIIQAVADTMNLKIHVIESDSNYREITLVQPANATSDIRSIYIGHMGQMHYVSTCTQITEMLMTFNKLFQMIQYKMSFLK